MVSLFNIIVILSTLIVALSSSISDLNKKWNYESSKDWYQLKGSESCKITSSSIQSPIDFNNINVDNELEYPSYKVLNNGCSNWEKYSNDYGFGVDFNKYIKCNNLSIIYKGNEYFFNKFQFHSPSEHSINGEYFSGEVQLLHSNADNTANLIVSVLITENLDSKIINNLFLDTLWTVNNIKSSLPLNPYSSFISNDQSHYDYVGSLTSPPCTEGINWIVLSEAVVISSIDFYNLQTKLSLSLEKGQGIKC
jgi:carbonic anhydrase